MLLVIFIKKDVMSVFISRSNTNLWKVKKLFPK